MEDNNKRKQDLEDEMSRFEQEISGNLPPPPKMPHMMNTGNRPPFMMPPPPHFNKKRPNIPFPGPPPMPVFQRPPMDGMRHMDRMMPMQRMPHGLIPPPMMVPPPVFPPAAQSLTNAGGNHIAPPTVPLKNYDSAEMAQMMFNPGFVGGGEGSSSMTAGASKIKKDKKKSLVRVAGGTVWEDSTLLDWETNDFRIFVGDLGNEVSDDALLRAFSKYPSLLKAKVVRDKKTKKTKGFGFVSFKDPQDYLKAMREMNGKYVGNRPVKLRKSTWKDRNINIAKKKEKEKKKLGLR